MDINLVDMMGGSLKDLLSDMKKELKDGMVPEENLTSALSSLVSMDTVDISPESITMSSSTNMMEGNFVGGFERDDTYINARAAGNAAADEVMAAKDNAMSSSLINLGSDARWYGSRKLRNAKTLKDNIESNKQVLNDVKKNIEEKSAEAQAPKGENGKPIEQVVTASGGTGEASATTATEAPATTVTAAPDVEVNLEGVTKAAQVLSSIDITIQSSPQDS